MPWEAVAVVGAAYLSSEGSKDAADTQSQSARDATAAQTAAADKSNQTQLQLQQNALNFEQQQTSLYTQAGQTALQSYMEQLGLTPPTTGSSTPHSSSNGAVPSGALGMWMGPGAPPAGSSNSSSTLTRDQLIKQLTPQFTKTVSANTAFNPNTYNGATGPNGAGSTAPPATTTTLDQAGLNAAVDAALKKQGTTMAPATPATAVGSVNNGQQKPFDVSKIPGYAFMKKEALDALSNSASASTGALSGNAQKALVDRISGLASTEYGSYLDRISGLVSLGENAGVHAGNTGAGIIQGAGNNISANQMALGGQIGSNLIGAGNASAAGQIGSGNAWGSAANTIFGNQQTQKSLSSLFSNDNSVSDSTANSWNTDEMARITAQAG